jgi:hypothetical protein
LLFSPGTFTVYDFSAAPDAAYGSNESEANGRWQIYSGDVDQNGQVDLNDLKLVDSDAYNHITGYTRTDVDGNGYVDIFDQIYTDMNIHSSVIMKKPSLAGTGASGEKKIKKTHAILYDRSNN